MMCLPTPWALLVVTVPGAVVTSSQTLDSSGRSYVLSPLARPRPRPQPVHTHTRSMAPSQKFVPEARRPPARGRVRDPTIGQRVLERADDPGSSFASPNLSRPEETPPPGGIRHLARTMVMSSWRNCHLLRACPPEKFTLPAPLQGNGGNPGTSLPTPSHAITFSLFADNTESIVATGEAPAPSETENYSAIFYFSKLSGLQGQFPNYACSHPSASA